jgi:HlyD family secretion protein
VAYVKLKPAGLPASIASGNGRLEATEFDIATRSGGRIKSVQVQEGDDVAAGQVLAIMDTSSLEADLRRAQSQVTQARNARTTAQALLAQREQSVLTAQAVVAQRQAEQALAGKQWQRTRELVGKGFLAPQKLDEAQAQRQSVKAALSAALSQVAEAKAAVLATRSQVVEADSAIESAQAALARVEADQADTALKAPKGGRVQTISARAGEVLGGGGRVLSLVDLHDVSMTFFLPEMAAGKLAIGAEARLVMDAAPQFVVPAKVVHVASVAQFTPKTVETTAERQKMVFKVKAQVDPALLERFRSQVKTGMPGMAYVRTNAAEPWPAQLTIALPAAPGQAPGAGQ